MLYFFLFRVILCFFFLLQSFSLFLRVKTSCCNFVCRCYVKVLLFSCAADYSNSQLSILFFLLLFNLVWHLSISVSTYFFFLNRKTMISNNNSSYICIFLVKLFCAVVFFLAVYYLYLTIISIKQ